MAVGMGGRSAEEVVFNEVTTGAQNDLQQVTNVARAMVTQLGMSEEVGPAYFGGEGSALDGASYNPWEPKEYSDETAARIDAAVVRLVNEAHDTARRVLTENRSALDAIAEALIHEESIDADELTKIVNAHRAAGQEPIRLPAASSE
jgi:cell division protease FtsH